VQRHFQVMLKALENLKNAQLTMGVLQQEKRMEVRGRTIHLYVLLIRIELFLLHHHDVLMIIH